MSGSLTFLASDELVPLVPLAAAANRRQLVEAMRTALHSIGPDLNGALHIDRALRPFQAAVANAAAIARRTFQLTVCDYLIEFMSENQTYVPLPHLLRTLLGLLRLFLEHGLVLFTAGRISRASHRHRNLFVGLLAYSPPAYMAITAQHCAQLLALGYGRDELASDSSTLPPMDRQLTSTRTHAECACIVRPDVKQAARCGLAYFDEHCCPLALCQLARVAVRRALIGPDFVRRAQQLRMNMPPLLFDYVFQPTEEIADAADL